MCVCVGGGGGNQGGAVGVEELGAEGAKGAVGPLAGATSLGEKRPLEGRNQRFCNKFGGKSERFP